MEFGFKIECIKLNEEESMLKRVLRTTGLYSLNYITED